MRIDKHIFGSINGYRTQAKTDGISLTDLRQLEHLSIGGASSPHFLKALASAPAYMIHSLGTRRALTRFAAGPRDDAGRLTVEQITLVLSAQNWDDVLAGDISGLIAERGLWVWNQDVSLARLDVPISRSQRIVPAGSATKVLIVLSEMERSFALHKPVLVREQDLSLDEFTILASLLPPQLRSVCPLIFRGFAKALPASLVTMAREIDDTGSRCLSLSKSSPQSPYAQHLARTGFQLGRIPLDVVRDYTRFGATTSTSQASLPSKRKRPWASTPPQVIVERNQAPFITLLLAACILLLLTIPTVRWLTDRTWQRKYDSVNDDNSRQVRSLEAKLQEAKSALDKSTQQVKGLEADKGVKEKEAKGWHDMYNSEVKKNEQQLNELNTLNTQTKQQQQEASNWQDKYNSEVQDSRRRVDGLNVRINDKEKEISNIAKTVTGLQQQLLNHIEAELGLPLLALTQKQRGDLKALAEDSEKQFAQGTAEQQHMHACVALLTSRLKAADEQVSAAKARIANVRATQIEVGERAAGADYQELHESLKRYYQSLEHTGNGSQTKGLRASLKEVLDLLENPDPKSHDPVKMNKALVHLMSEVLVGLEAKDKRSSNSTVPAG